MFLVPYRNILWRCIFLLSLIKVEGVYKSSNSILLELLHSSLSCYIIVSACASLSLARGERPADSRVISQCISQYTECAVRNLSWIVEAHDALSRASKVF